MIETLKLTELYDNGALIGYTLITIIDGKMYRNAACICDGEELQTTKVINVLLEFTKDRINSVNKPKQEDHMPCGKNKKKKK